MKLSSYAFFALFLLFTVSACGDDDGIPQPGLTVPATYTFERAGQSTVSFSGQTTRIEMATDLIQAFLEFDRTEEELDNMFTNAEGTNPFRDDALNTSGKSLRSKVAASRDLFFTDATTAAAIKADFDGWIAAQVAEVFPNQNELAAAGQAGQIADGSSTRYISAWGLEYNQAFAKSLIGALMFDQIVNNYLSPAVLDEGSNRVDNDAGTLADGKDYTTMEHKWDEAFGYLFGAAADPSLPLEDLEDADDFLNKYLGRVENDPDYTGIAEAIELNFRVGRAAIVAGEYAERDARALGIRQRLVDVIAIRSVYYLKQGQAKLEATPIDRGAGFHDLSEAYGFIYSLRFVGGEFTNSVVDDYLITLRNAPGNGWWDLDPSLLNEMAIDIANKASIEVSQAAN